MCAGKIRQAGRETLPTWHYLPLALICMGIRNMTDRMWMKGPKTEVTRTRRGLIAGSEMIPEASTSAATRDVYLYRLSWEKKIQSLDRELDREVRRYSAGLLVRGAVQMERLLVNVHSLLVVVIAILAILHARRVNGLASPLSGREVCSQYEPWSEVSRRLLPAACLLHTCDGLLLRLSSFSCGIVNACCSCLSVLPRTLERYRRMRRMCSLKSVSAVPV
jgi:hypothetical protein